MCVCVYEHKDSFSAPLLRYIKQPPGRAARVSSTFTRVMEYIRNCATHYIWGDIIVCICVYVCFMYACTHSCAYIMYARGYQACVSVFLERAITTPPPPPLSNSAKSTRSFSFPRAPATRCRHVEVENHEWGYTQTICIHIHRRSVCGSVVGRYIHKILEIYTTTSRNKELRIHP